MPDRGGPAMGEGFLSAKKTQSVATRLQSVAATLETVGKETDPGQGPVDTKKKKKKSFVEA